MNILENLKKIIPEEKIKENEPMKNHTSFKIGGPAEFFVKIDEIDELKKILELCKTNKINLTIVGNGSNILVSDKGIKGIVIKLELKKVEIKNIDIEKREILVDAGVPIGLFAQKLLKEEISGFEELSGIPGTIGGAIIMNAGAHGKEMKDIVTEITALDYEGNIHKFTNEESEFQYRKSRFSREKYIILQAKLVLKNGKKEDIKSKMNEYLQYRKEKQPIEFPSAGSTFKRGEDFITAKLIDEAGLKGYSIGGAQISEKHAGFIINKGNATAQNVIDLAKFAADKVYEKFGKKIELEIKIIGKE
ncbi:MAG: UDP-N-acetylmuramate dehydrogenase [Clostridia bacterium]|nr:UDP-N-acetylmuramate dehydrogenase [Clostridia bacterium]